MLLLLLIIGGAIAQDYGHMLVLQLASGRTQSYILSEKPTITFDGAYLKVESGAESIPFLRSDIKDFHFAEVTDISSVEHGELRVVRRNNDELNLYGLEEADKHIRVYRISGTPCPVDISLNATAATVSLETLPKGIYVVKIGNKQSIKITKK